MADVPVQHTLRVSLRGGKDNATYSGTLLIRNWTSLLHDPNPAAEPSESTGLEDPTGASYYVVAVVMVYGMSIVMLIASHIKRKHQKLVEDRQINKYLQEFLVVQEKSSRDSYRNLKRTIIAKLYKDKSHTSRHLSKAIFPMMAIALPNPVSSQEQLSEPSSVPRHYSIGSRPSITSARLPAYHSLDERASLGEDSDTSHPRHSRHNQSSTSDAQHDSSLDPFEGIDPALSDSSFHESDQDILEEEEEERATENVLEDSSASQFCEIEPSKAQVPGTSHSSNDNIPAAGDSTLTVADHRVAQRKVSWCDDTSDSLITAINGVSDNSSGSHEPGQAGSATGGPGAPEKRDGSPEKSYTDLPIDSDVHDIYRPSVPWQPSDQTKKKKKPHLDILQWNSVGGRSNSRKAPIDGQFDLAAALLRNSIAYHPPPPLPPPSRDQRPVSYPNAIRPSDPAAQDATSYNLHPDSSSSSTQHPTTGPSNSSNSSQPLNKPQTKLKANNFDGPSAVSGDERLERGVVAGVAEGTGEVQVEMEGEGEGRRSRREGVWQLNEQTRGGLMREEDPELFSLRHGHGMGSLSPLIKDTNSPVTPPSPHYGARLTPQPLLTPPATKGSRIINPFFAFAASAKRATPQPSPRPSPRHSPTPSQRHSPSPLCLLPNGRHSRSQSPSSRETSRSAAGLPGVGRASPSSPPDRRSVSPGDDDSEQERLLHITCV